jgi:hypothetical protein
MKKMIAAVALLAATFAAQAQGIHPRVEVAGNFSTNIVKDAKGVTVDGYKVRPGFRVAGAVEVGLLGPLYIAPGVAFQQNGSKAGNETVTLNYLSVPVNLGLHVALGGLGVSLEGGPSFSYGISAKSTAPAEAAKEAVKEAVDQFKNGGLKRFETGVNASVAVHLSSLYFRLGSDIGLTNIYKNKADEGSLKNASFYLGVGLRF